MKLNELQCAVLTQQPVRFAAKGSKSSSGDGRYDL